MTRENIIIQCSTSTAPAGGVSKNAAGAPVQKFVKDLISVGRLYGGGGKHQDFRITKDDHSPKDGRFSLRHFCEQFKRMKSAGVDVPTPAGHSNEAEDNRGFLRDVFTQGNTLYGVIEAIGEDAIQLASRSKVSINVIDQITSGSGDVFEHPINHVALVTDPVVPNQQEFVALSASQKKEETQTIVLSTEQTNMEDEQKNEGDKTQEKQGSPAIEKIAKLLGVEVADGEDLSKAVIAYIEAMKAKKEGDNKKDDKKEDDKKEGGGQPSVAASLDRNMSKILVENAELKLSRLVEGGNITPACREKFIKRFVGSANQPNALTLSANQNGGSILDDVVEILGSNDPVSLREKTKSQNAITASRRASADDTAALVKDMVSGATSDVAL